MSELSDLTAQCIRCGFCLESCPTFIETGQETESPRGRIYLVRSAVEGGLNWDEGVRPHLEGCLGCRACETACPSGVKYGEILEQARSKIENDRPQRSKKLLLDGLTNPGALKMQLALGKLWPGKRMPGFVSRLLSNQDTELDLPSVEAPVKWPALDNLPPIKGEVYVLEGCVMPVLYGSVGEATNRLLRRLGYQAKLLRGCCGALHSHNGYLKEGQNMLETLLSGKSENLPLIVNSAGCGSWLKDASSNPNIFDATEFLSAEGLEDLLRSAPPSNIRLTYHDACHLAHGQSVRDQPRQLLSSIPGIEFVELKEADHCCGSAGIYNMMQPKMARKLLNRKWNNVAESKAQIVATGNPGCHAWIAQAAREHGQTVTVMHTLEVLERALSGLSLC